MIRIILLSFLVSVGSFALEIDEKLTLRLIKASESKKTILINRGQEDGLAKADHAKFFLSTGVIARGVCVKVSPSRSVWSLYRLVNAGYVKDDQVLQLKITKAVKITADESKSLVADDSRTAYSNDPRVLGIPLADGADDVSASTVSMTPEEAAMMSSVSAAPSQSLSSMNKEVFASFTYSSKKSEVGQDNQTFSGSDTFMSLDLGFEYYFKDDGSWLARLSPFAGMKMIRSQAMSFEGSSVSESSSLFGGGMNLYPMTLPFKSNTFIPYLSGSFYFGSSQSTITEGSTGTTDETVASSVVYYSFGGGYKYYTSKGYGASLALDYVIRGDTFAEDENSKSWVKTGSGLKIYGAFRYRF